MPKLFAPHTQLIIRVTWLPDSVTLISSASSTPPCFKVLLFRSRAMTAMTCDHPISAAPTVCGSPILASLRNFAASSGGVGLM